MSPRKAQLKPRFDQASGKWVLSIPPNLSKTGKRQRKFFDEEEQAKAFADNLNKLRQKSEQLAKDLTTEDLAAAMQAKKDLMWFGLSLKQGLEAYIHQLQLEHRGKDFGDLLAVFERDYKPGWSKARTTTWNVWKKHLIELADRKLQQLDGAFWIEWLGQKATANNWSDRTYNNWRTLTGQVWGHAVRLEWVEKNPMEQVLPRKLPKQTIAVATPAEVQAIMDKAWEQERRLAPWFAIAFFAGLRTKSELDFLTWKQIDFDQGWIAVAASKTETDRYVPIEDNLRAWLETVPRKERRGRLYHWRKAREAITAGTRWGTAGRDFARHSYGSYLEAKYKDANLVKENMGHADFKTYRQYYRNARTPQEAAEYWGIVPPH